jgi:hypothetical protein
MRNVRYLNIFLKKFNSNMMICYNLMKFIILKYVSQIRKIVTY